MALEKSGSNWSLNYGDSLNSKRNGVGGGDSNNNDDIPFDDGLLESNRAGNEENKKTLTESQKRVLNEDLGNNLNDIDNLLKSNRN